MADADNQAYISGAMANLPAGVNGVYGSSSGGNPANTGMRTNGFFTGNSNIDMFLAAATSLLNGGRPTLNTYGRPNMSAYTLTAVQTRQQLMNQYSPSMYAMNPSLGALGPQGSNTITQMLADSFQKGGSIRNEFGVYASEAGKFMAGPGMSNGVIQSNMRGAANMVKNIEDGMHGANGLWDYQKSFGFTREQFGKNAAVFGDVLGGWDHFQNLSRDNATPMQKAAGVRWAQGASETVRIAQDLFGKDMPLDELKESTMGLFRGQHGVSKGYMDDAMRRIQATGVVSNMSNAQMVQYQGVAKEILNSGGVSTGHVDMANEALLAARRGEAYTGPGATELAQMHLQGDINIANSPVNSKVTAALLSLPEGDVRSNVLKMVGAGDTTGAADYIEKSRGSMGDKAYQTISQLQTSIEQHGRSASMTDQLNAQYGQGVVNNLSGMNDQKSIHSAIGEVLMGAKNDPSQFYNEMIKMGGSRQEYQSIVDKMNGVSIQRGEDLNEFAQRHNLGSADVTRLSGLRQLAINERPDSATFIPTAENEQETVLSDAKRSKSAEEAALMAKMDKERAGLMVDQGIGGIVGGVINDAIAENYKKSQVAGAAKTSATPEEVMQKLEASGVSKDNMPTKESIQGILDLTQKKGKEYDKLKPQMDEAEKTIREEYKKRGKTDKETNEAVDAAKQEVVQKKVNDLSGEASTRVQEEKDTAKWTKKSDGEQANETNPQKLVEQILAALSDISGKLSKEPQSKSGEGGASAPTANQSRGGIHVT